MNIKKIKEILIDMDSFSCSAYEQKFGNHCLRKTSLMYWLAKNFNAIPKPFSAFDNSLRQIYGRDFFEDKLERIPFIFEDKLERIQFINGYMKCIAISKSPVKEIFLDGDQDGDNDPEYLRRLFARHHI